MFVIPSKYVENISPIKECIDSIIKFHPKEKILIVDSYSDDVSYLKEFVKISNVIISKYKNKHYECGALYYAYKEYPKEHYYALIQDSIILRHSWEEFLFNDTTYNLLYFDNYPLVQSIHRPEREYVTNVIKKIDYDNNIDGFVGIFGILAIYKQDIMKILIDKKVLETSLPIDKFGSEMTERIFGICLAQDGYDIINNSIEGNFWNKNKTMLSGLKYFQKKYGGRQ